MSDTIKQIAKRIEQLERQVFVPRELTQRLPMIEGYAQEAVLADGKEYLIDVWIYDETGTFVDSGVDKNVVSHGPEVAVGEWLVAISLNGSYRVLGSGEATIPVLLGARTEVAALVGTFASHKTGLYDWTEIEHVKSSDTGFRVKPGGRSGTFEECTACVHEEYGNMAIEGSTRHIRPCTVDESIWQKASSSSSSSCAIIEQYSSSGGNSGGYAYVIIGDHLNTIPPP